MTLYEDYQNGLDVVIYCEKAYKNLLNAFKITSLVEDGFYDATMWPVFLNIGCIDWITKKNGALDLVKDSFNLCGDFIDSRQLAMMRDYEQMPIADFLKLYKSKVNMVINKEDSRAIKCITGLASDFEVLDCITTKGPRRFENEDFTCCATSPNNEFKLLMVCDGVGGQVGGENASELVVNNFIKWFNSCDLKFDNIPDELNRVLKKIKEDIKKESFLAATTLTFAIIGKERALIGNVGDSRAYLIKDGIFNQVTKDDSLVWEDYIDGKKYVLEKDMLRFLPYNNVITNAIDFINVKIQTYDVLNSAYDGILLCSDGVSDILSDETMMRIFSESKSKDFLSKLLYESCFGNPDYPDKESEELLYPTLPGNDNASAAMYLRR